MYAVDPGLVSETLTTLCGNPTVIEQEDRMRAGGKGQAAYECVLKLLSVARARWHDGAPKPMRPAGDPTIDLLLTLDGYVSTIAEDLEGRS